MRNRSFVSFLRWFPLACLLIWMGCASNNDLEETRDAAGGGDTRDERDSGAADSGGVAEQDVSSEDSGGADDGVNDRDEAEDPCEICCPGDISCIDEETLGTCREDGSGFDEESCDEGSRCEGNACVSQPVCTEGESTCHDGTTRLVCRPGGTGWRTESCEGDKSCVAGQCTSGDPTGFECETAGDCAGGLCHCGEGESCELPAQSGLQGYCSAACTPGSCGADEVCVSSAHWAAAQDDHCLPGCSRSCNQLPGMTCASVPTMDSGELTFEEACVPAGTVNIGERCEASDECSGGVCLLDYFKVGLCTTECTGNCPDGNACVKLTNDTYYCSPICGDGSPGNSAPCPLGGSEGVWDARCKTETLFGGGVKQVCAKAG